MYYHPSQTSGFSTVLRTIVICTACGLLGACGGGGGGGGGVAAFNVGGKNAVLTAAQQKQLDLNPNVLCVPIGLVPAVYQGKQLLYTEMEVEGESFTADGGTQLKITLKMEPGGGVTEGRAEHKLTASGTVLGGTDFPAGGSWTASATRPYDTTVRTFTLASYGGDATLSMRATNLNMAGKTVTGNTTTYTGRISGGECSLGNGAILQLGGMNVTFKLTYHIAE